MLGDEQKDKLCFSKTILCSLLFLKFYFYLTSYLKGMSHSLGIDLIILLWHINVSIKLEPFIILKAMVPQRSFTSVIPVSATRASGQSMGTLRNKPLLWPGIWETAAIGLSGGYLASLWKRTANAIKLAVNFPWGKAPQYCISLLGNLK